MPRPRIHKDNAARQKAYRERLRERGEPQLPPEPVTKSEGAALHPDTRKAQRDVVDFLDGKRSYAPDPKPVRKEARSPRRGR